MVASDPQCSPSSLVQLAKVSPVVGDNAAEDWWSRAVFYQIYPRSFADGNGDGIGDLYGIEERIEYLSALGIDAVWISPFYPSPQHDHGYDVADYLSINPDYGTLSDAERLFSILHEHGIRVIIDVVPNHSSSEHPMFQAALASEPGSPERERYIFRYSDYGKPNNWGSMFSGSAWSSVYDLTGKDSDRGWWYLHMFDSSQPDWNWENAEVRHMFDDYLRFWCDRGVDGFRVDVAHALIKAEGLPDDEFGPERYQWVDPTGDGRTSRAPDRGPYFNQPGVHEVFRRWRGVLDEYGPDRMMVAEAVADTPEQLALFVRPGEMNQTFNFDVLACGWNAVELSDQVACTLSANAGVGAVNTWVLNNHDRVRHCTRFGYPVGAYTINGVGPTDPRPDLEIGHRRANAMTLFLCGLPGAMYIYNGEELGLPEVLDIPNDRRVDPMWQRSGGSVVGRDGCRVPLPWKHDAVNAGFGAGGEPWLPQPAYWAEYAADLQEANSGSELHWYRRLLAVRKEARLGEGHVEFVHSHPDCVVVRHGEIVLAINMGSVAHELPVEFSSRGEILMTSAADPADEGSVVTFEGASVTLAPNYAVWIRP